MTQEQVASLARTALISLGSILVAKGYTDNAGLEALVGGAINIGTVAWAMFRHREAAVSKEPQNVVK